MVVCRGGRGCSGGWAGCYRTWRNARKSGPQLFTSSPPCPLETLWICTLSADPTGLCSFLCLCFILFLALHIPLSVSVSAALLLWPLFSCCVSCFLLCLGLWGGFSTGYQLKLLSLFASFLRECACSASSLSLSLSLCSCGEFFCFP